MTTSEKTEQARKEEEALYELIGAIVDGDKEKIASAAYKAAKVQVSAETFENVFKKIEGDAIAKYAQAAVAAAISEKLKKQ
ncbi:MAG: hypothetical protein ACP5UH_01325 [Candidatus Micrarchaeia archaeon]